MISRKLFQKNLIKYEKPAIDYQAAEGSMSLTKSERMLVNMLLTSNYDLHRMMNSWIVCFFHLINHLEFIAYSTSKKN